MPFIIPIAVGAAAALAAASFGVAAGILGFVGIAATASAIGIVAGAIGSIVAGATSMLMGALMAPKQKTSGIQDAQDRKQLIRAPVNPRQIIYGWQRVGGDIVYASSTGSDQRFLHLVVVLAGHPIEKIGTIWINDKEIPQSALPAASADGVVRGYASTLSGRVYVEKYLGNQTAACSFLVAASTDGWSISHVGRGQAYLYLRLEYDREMFGGGLQSVQAEVLGKKILDPRTGATAYSNNASLVVLDYLRSADGVGAPDTAIDTSSFIAAANICDEAVATNAAGTETQKRYTADFAFRRDLTRREVLRKLLTASAGTLVWIQGQYRLYVGAYQTPTDTLTADDLAGPIRLTPKTALREQFNAVKGTFVSPEHNFQAHEFPAVTSGTFEAEDGGARRWRELELPATLNSVRAQRLARMELLRGRRQIGFQAPLKYGAIRYGIWQMLSVTLDDFGWASKPFRVNGWSFNHATGEVSIRLREESSAAYAWTWDLAGSLNDAPDTNLVNPLVVPAPTGLTLSQSTVLAPDGTTVPALVASWTAAASAFVTAHEVRWRVGSTGSWNSQEVPAGTDRLVIRPVLLGTAYDVQVRAVANLARSDWTGTASAAGAPDTTPPGAVTGLAVTAVPRGFVLRWTNPSDSDLDRIDIYENAGAGAGFVKIAESRTNFITLTNYQPDDYRQFYVRPVDRSGNQGSATAWVAAVVPRLITNDVQDEAITSSAGATYSGSSTSSTYFTLCSVVVSAEASSRLFIAGTVGFANPASWDPTLFHAAVYRIMRGGTQLILGSATDFGDYSLQLTENPGVGIHTYELQALRVGFGTIARGNLTVQVLRK